MSSGTDQPNVVVIFNDDLGYGDVGCFGSPTIRTPNLDRMAAEGVKFTSFNCAGPTCTPSRAGLMTGSYATRIGWDGGVLFPDAEKGLDPAEETVADVLHDAGYATSCIGKWHLGDREEFLPTNHGFDRYFGIPYSNDMGRQVEDSIYEGVPLLRGTEVVEERVDQRTLTRRYADEAIEFVEENRDEPFFCFLANSMPHVPLYPSEEFEGRSRRGTYGDVVEEIDHNVGRILSALDRLGIDDETLVLFTSDHGPWLGKGANGGDAGPLREGKFEVWEGGYRVPAIARWPGEIPAGSVCQELVSAIDLLPTAASLAGTDLPDTTVDGEDLSPLLRAPESTESPHDHFFYYGPGAELAAVRDAEGWKLHVATDEYDDAPDADALYHLGEDVGEQRDVAEERPDVVERLRGALTDFDEDVRENVRPSWNAD